MAYPQSPMDYQVLGVSGNPAGPPKCCHGSPPCGARPDLSRLLRPFKKAREAAMKSSRNEENHHF